MKTIADPFFQFQFLETEKRAAIQLIWKDGGNSVVLMGVSVLFKVHVLQTSSEGQSHSLAAIHTSWDLCW